MINNSTTHTIMATLFDRIIQVSAVIASVLFVAFAIFNLVRGIIAGEFFPIFAFACLTLLALGFLGSSIEEIKKD